MKSLALLTSFALAVAGALLFVPALQTAVPVIAGAVLLLAVVTLVVVAQLGGSPAPGPAPQTVEATPRSVPPPAPTAKGPPAGAEGIALLGLLQEKGRFLDFVMDDIASYQDAQVGAAARVVHQGCRDVLRDHFSIAAVSPAAEGSAVTVPSGDEAADYRLVGRIAGEPPFTGTLVHKGWKTASVRLPTLVMPDTGRLPALFPAQVELR